MKFYDFTDFEYYALIWANDKYDALKKYNDEVCNIFDAGQYKKYPTKVDVDVIADNLLKGLAKSGIDDDDFRNGAVKESLYKIITSGETQVILIDPNLA